MIKFMSPEVDTLSVYLHLAHASDRRQRPQVRDRLLVLAATCAAHCLLPRIAAYCRHKVLQHNPRHVLGHWETVESALREPDFQALWKNLLRQYPQEKAEAMLAGLGIERGRERDTYYSDEEYAAALLGTNQGTLTSLFGE